MADQPMIGIEDFKRLPHSSSSHISKIEAETRLLYEAADAHFSTIYRFANMQEFISGSSMEKCGDALAAIKQIEAALAELLGHFSNTIARQSLEYAHNHAKETLRKANLCVERLAQYFER